MDALAHSATLPPVGTMRDVASQGAQAPDPGLLVARDAIFATLHSQARALAHALGNPLTGLSLTLELLASSQLNPEQQRYVDRCLRVVERLNATKDNLGLLGSPNSAELELVDLHACIHGVLAQLRLATTFTAHVALAADAEVAWAHPGLLADALTQLLRNAVEALGHGGLLGIRCARQLDQVVLTVWDRGPGLSPAAEAQLWISPIHGKPHSSGLGLFWASAIVDHVHGGRLSYSREPGGGAAFHVALAARPAGAP